MNKYDALFVRAIKSKSPEFRLKRLYQKFYCADYTDYHVVGILSRIVDEYDIMQTKDWIDGLNPDNAWKYGCEATDSHYSRCVSVMSSFIRLTRVDKFDNFPLTAYWRNKK